MAHAPLEHPPPSGAVAPAREAINRMRRRCALRQAATVLIAGPCLVAWAYFGGGPGIVLLLAFAVIVSIPAALSRQPCPQCRNDLSRLPGQGHLTIPSLSHAICACPFCGLDIALPPGSGRPPACSAASVDSASPSSARAVINASRRYNGLVNTFGPMVAVGVFALAALYAGSHPPSAGSIAAWGAPGVLFFHVIVRSFTRREACPSCEHDVTMLPSERGWRLPELARDIRFCPYCRADFGLATGGPEAGGASVPIIHVNE